MKIAIYGRKINEAAIKHVQELFDKLKSHKAEISIFEPFQVFLSSRIQMENPVQTFTNYEELNKEIDFLISLGGDGTMLETVSIIRDSKIPVLGINMGRLGFLANVSKENIENAIDSLYKGHYTIDSRALIRLESDKNLFNGVNYALNELTIHKKDTSSMITIHTYLNGEFLNSYWADGLIVCTPTGSTGYSLACGGPIIFPKSGNFGITPIAPHNLNVRPVVISDKNVISFEIEGRSSNFLITLDSRTETIDSTVQLAVRRENFDFHLVKLNSENYLNTLRNKLMWGYDSRN